MYLSERKKFSVHLDISALRQVTPNNPLSSKRKIETTPTSPNTIGSDKKFKPIKPLHTNKNSINTIQSIIANFQNKTTNGKENPSTMSKFPLLVDQFIKLYNLQKNEIDELNTLKQIYYYKQSKIAYDGQNGEYLCYQKDHIKYQYEIISLIGQGSFGQVFQVIDHKSQKTFALKIIRNQEKLKKQAQVESNLLNIIKDKDPNDNSHIVRVHEAFIFRGHQCIVFEKLDKNLFEILKQQKFRGFDYDTLRKFALQILIALNFLKKQNILHCDLKPENVMLSDEKKKIVKLVDFGSGCLNGQQIYTYIQSRYYRAPEVIFGLKYGPEIDMWSFGCLIAEIHTGQPIFPGDNELEQFNLITEIIGSPNPEFAQNCPRKKYFFDEYGYPKKTIKIYRKPQSVDLHDVLKTTDDDFVDFIQKCFQWDATKRITPDEAINHPWLQNVQLFKNQTQNEYKKSKTQQNLIIQQFEKKLSKDNIFQKLQQTRNLITNNYIGNSPRLNEQPVSSDRNRANIMHSLHQILSCRGNTNNLSQFFRKPSVG